MRIVSWLQIIPGVSCFLGINRVTRLVTEFSWFLRILGVLWLLRFLGVFIPLMIQRLFRFLKIPGVSWIERIPVVLYRWASLVSPG